MYARILWIVVIALCSTPAFALECWKVNYAYAEKRVAGTFDSVVTRPIPVSAPSLGNARTEDDASVAEITIMADVEYSTPGATFFWWLKEKPPLSMAYVNDPYGLATQLLDVDHPGRYELWACGATVQDPTSPIVEFHKVCVINAFQIDPRPLGTADENDDIVIEGAAYPDKTVNPNGLQQAPHLTMSFVWLGDTPHEELAVSIDDEAKGKILWGDTSGGSALELMSDFSNGYTFLFPGALNTWNARAVGSSGSHSLAGDDEAYMTARVEDDGIPGNRCGKDDTTIVKVEKFEVAAGEDYDETHQVDSTNPPAANGQPFEHFCAVRTHDNGLKRANIGIHAKLIPETIRVKDHASWDDVDSFTDNEAKIDKVGPAKEKTPVFKLAGTPVRKAKAWVIWADNQANVVPAVGTINGGGWLGLKLVSDQYSKFKVLPDSLFIAGSDSPNLSTDHETDVPGHGDPYFAGASTLGGTSVGRWDVSRRAKAKWLNPNAVESSLSPTGPFNAPAGTPWATTTAGGQYAAYPGDTVVGNDDTHADDEKNDPYTAAVIPDTAILAAVGEVGASDNPGTLLDNTWTIAPGRANNGDVIEDRTHFGDFVRLELPSGPGGQTAKWYRCSDFANWRIHYRFEYSFVLPAPPAPGVSEWTKDVDAESAADNAGY